MVHNIKLYMAFAKVTFLTQLEYRGVYFVRILSKIVAWGSGFVMLLVLLNRFKTIGNWSTYEILLLYSMNVLTYSIAATFVMNPFEYLSRNIRTGVFDSVLVRPVNSLFYYVCQNVSAGYTSNYVIGGAVMIICLSKLELSVTPFGVLLFVLSFAGAILIHASAFLITYIPAFWVTESTSIFNLFYGDLTRFVDYPITIYPKLVQGLLTFVLPYAFISFYPVDMFLGKSDTVFSPVLSYASPVVGVILFIIAYNFWNLGIKNYKSTGS